MTVNKTILAAQADDVIKALYQRAESHRESFATNAVICGQMLLEKRWEMAHRLAGDTRGTNVLLDSNAALHARSDDTFTAWAETALNLARGQRTYYRWMAAAGAVMRHLLGKSPSDPAPVTLLGHRGQVLVSQVLIATDDFLKNLPAGTQAFRDQFAAFMQDKSLREANIAVLEGHDPSHRTTRAANGKHRGGAGAHDRSDTPYFVAFRLNDLATHIGRWGKLNDTQRTEVKMLLRAFITGEKAKLPGREDACFSFGHKLARSTDTSAPLPRELREAIAEALREANTISRLAGEVAGVV